MVFNKKEYDKTYGLSHKKEAKEYRLKNREKRNMQCRAWHQAHKKEEKEKAGQRHLKNKLTDNLRCKNYNLTHQAERKAYRKMREKERREYNEQYNARPEVKQRQKENRKLYNLLHPEKVKEKANKNKVRNSEYHKQWRLQNKDWLVNYKRENREVINKQKNKRKIERYYSDVLFKLNWLISSGINKSLKRQKQRKNGASWEEIVGYSKQELQTWLFGSKNSGKEFLSKDIDIDHKTPKAWFKTKEDLIKYGWALENLQLLPSNENNIKGDKYCSDVMLALSQIGR